MIDVDIRQKAERTTRAALRRRWTTVALAAVFLLPLIVMAVEVATAPLMPTLDYWTMLGRTLNADGSLHERGLITFQNGHPTFLPGLLLYINAAFLGGTNTALGVASLIFATATVLLLAGELRRSELSRVRVSVGAIAIAWLLFTPKGLHNFVYGFSGVAWLSANFFIVLAIILSARGRHRTALLPAFVACACYGSGFAVWPALLAIQWLRRADRRMMLCTSASGIAVVATWLAARPSVPSQGTDGGFQSYVQAFFAVAGGLWTSTNVEFAVVMGLLTVGCALVAIARAPLPSCPPSSLDHPVATDVERLRALILRRRPVSDSALPWLGILVWASCAFLLIASSRAETDVFVGLGSRYASIPALMVSAVGALALMTATTPGLRKAALPAALLAALGIAGATGIHRDIHSRYDAIELSAVAARLGVPDLVPESPIATDRLTSAAAAGAYPYNRLFDHECNGLGLGDGVDSGAFSRLSGPPTAEVIARTVRQGDSGTLYTGAIDRTVENGGTRLDGWALIGGQPAECVLLLADDTVVGTGVTELPRGDLSPSFGIHSGLGWRAVAPAGLGPDDITVLVGRSGHSYVLPRGEGD